MVANMKIAVHKALAVGGKKGCALSISQSALHMNKHGKQFFLARGSAPKRPRQDLNPARVCARACTIIFPQRINS